MVSSATYFILVVSSLLQLAAGEMTTKQMTQMLQPFYRGIAAEYKFSFADNGTPPLELQQQPIMSWTGEESGLVSGDVFVWSKEGRPEVVGCIGSLPGRQNDRGVFHEFHTLSADKKLAPVTLIATGRTWSPGQGSEPREIPRAPVPDKSPRIRMAQMRKLAREFKPRMKVQLQGIEATQQQTTEGGFDNLRLLTQPLHRFDVDEIKKHPTAIDGAIFCYVWTRGTDPELLLLIEARKGDAGPKWFYTPIRFTFRELWLNHKNEEVWHHRGGNGRDNYSDPYITEWQGSIPIKQIQQQLNEAQGDK